MGVLGRRVLSAAMFPELPLMSHSKPVAELYQETTRGALIGLAVNLLLRAVKLVGGTIGHRLKDRLIEQFPTIRDVHVHLAPFPHSHPARPHV